MKDIDGVNHVGMAVRDLAATVAIFERMGFQLTPYSPQSGAWKPNEAVRSLGSGNRCIMFADDYLEVLASENPKEPSPRIEGFLARHQGAHIVCFNTEEPGAVDQRLRQDGIETSGVIPLQREIDTPDGARTARFERIQFAPGASPEGYIQAARHLTPEYIYQPRYIEHANGCFQLSETIVVVDDLDTYGERYARYLATQPVRDGATLRFDLARRTRLTLVPCDAAAAILPRSLFPPLPCIAGVAFRTRALEAVRAHLTAQGFTVTETAGRLVVPAEEASGLAIVFEN